MLHRFSSRSFGLGFFRAFGVSAVATAAALIVCLGSSSTAQAGIGRVCRDPAVSETILAGDATRTAPLTDAECGGPGTTIGTYYANSPVLRKFVDSVPGLTPGNANAFARGGSGEYLPIAEPDVVSFPGELYFVIGVVEHEQWMHSDLAKPTRQRSYVQLYPKKADRLAIPGTPFGTGDVPTPVAQSYYHTALGLPMPAPPQAAVPLFYPPDPAHPLAPARPVTWPNSTEQVYAVDNPHYLGPIVVTLKDHPTRITMVNFLPTGAATLNGSGDVLARNGDMFLPVDETLPGAGESSSSVVSGQFVPGVAYTITDGAADCAAVGALANAAIRDVFTATAAGSVGGTCAGVPRYSQSRVGFHLHGGDSPWINDGTPHQWIAAVGDPTPYKKGDRTFSPPDVPDPGEGSQQLYWPAGQTARLMWYHDHTFGLTRQNAYAGAAAGYVLIDSAELALHGGTPYSANGQTVNAALPGGVLDQLVFVVQDKTFVAPDIAWQDSKWSQTAWGVPGDLWYPHVYEPAQLWAANTVAGAGANLAAANPAGRWDYAVDPVGGYQPPLVQTLRDDPDYGMVAFPDGSYKDPSATPESYMDTPLVNGVAYPYIEVDPKAYRVRFLNGANDRYWNLSLWKADPTTESADHRLNTEVPMINVPTTLDVVNGTATGRQGGVPDPAMAGPHIYQFANEGGFLPSVVDYAPTPMNGFTDGFGVLTGARDSSNFYLGNAERADTVIDFSQYAGQTLILYNDSMAPVPGGDDRYDYYTNSPDRRAYGGAGSTPVGMGPNTRTVMQIRVRPGTPQPFVLADLNTQVQAAYKATQDTHMVDVAPEPVTGLTVTAYDSISGTDITLSDGSHRTVEVKTIEGYTDATFGRLIAQFGVEWISGTPQALTYVDPPTEFLTHDQTSYWYIKNHDADNHPVHFHLMNVQVLGRRDQATGAFFPPNPDEIGWKETVKSWPAEDLIVAIKPKTPPLPFGLAKSVRLLDPTLPEGAGTAGAIEDRPGQSTQFVFTQINYLTGQPAATPVVNSRQDFQWEYVWHCHILGHEENDLMRPLVFTADIQTPDKPTSVAVSSGAVSWTDPTPAGVAGTVGNPKNEYGFRVERRALNNNTADGAWSTLTDSPGMAPLSGVNTLANATSATDGASLSANTDYEYRVFAVNTVGEGMSDSAFVRTLPADASNLQGTGALATGGVNPFTVDLTWTDNATNETSYELVVDGGTPVALLKNANAASVQHTVTGATAGTSHTYQVRAVNAKGPSTAVQVSVSEPSAPAAPTGGAATGAWGVGSAYPVTLTWTDVATTETSYTIKKTVGATVTTYTAAANATSYTDNSVTVTSGAGGNAGTQISYQIIATSAVTGDSAPLAVSITLPATPAAPTGGSASGSWVGQTASYPVVLSWTGSSGAASYVIKRSSALSATAAATATAANATTTVATVAAGTTTWTDPVTMTTALAGRTYVYAITATNPIGTSAALVVKATLPAAPPVPGVPSISTSFNGTVMTNVLSWAPSANATAYSLTLDGRAITGATALAGTTYTSQITVAAPGGKVHTYGVKAVNAVGTSAASTATVTEPTASLAAPTGLAATVTPATASTVSVGLAWTDTSVLETGYAVLRATGTVSGSTVTYAAPVRLPKSTSALAANLTSYADTSAAANAVYQYYVAALNGETVGPQAGPLTVVTLTTLAAPTGVRTGSVTTTGLTLSWTASASSLVSGYEIDRCTGTATTCAAGGAVWTAVGTTASRTAVSLPVTGLVTKTGYVLRVRAVSTVTGATAQSAYATVAVTTK